MPIAKCPRCKKLFEKSELSVCSKCLPDEEADYETVREYVGDNPSCSAHEVAEQTGVDEDCVIRMIEEGRIMNAASQEQVMCGRCGQPAISVTKRLCQACLTELNTQVLQEQSRIKLPPREKETEVFPAAAASPGSGSSAPRSSGRLRETIEKKRRF
ncbi:MAG: hypothetical protein ACLFV4_07210 [Candidatus Hydrogenedentota bacterium]